MGEKIKFNAKAKPDEIITNNNTQRYEKESVLLNGHGGNRERLSNQEILARKKAKLLEDYSTVVVHDFCDDYHLSEEEKHEKSAFYDTARSIKQCKRKYRKLSQYVKAMRLCLDALYVVADKNGIYSSDDFIEKVLEGDIKVNGLNFPKYVGKDKNKINWEYIVNFILDKTKDYKTLEKTNLTKDEQDVDWEDEDEVEEYRRKVLGNDYDKIVNCDDSEEVYIEEFSHGEIKKINKMIPFAQDAVKDLNRLNREASKKVNGFIYELSRNDFDYIQEMDKRLGLSSVAPKFKGNLMDEDDYAKYMYELKKWEEENTIVDYHGTAKTKAEAKELEFKDSLEQCGWNLRAFYKGERKKEEKNRKKQEKRDKKQEKKLKKKLLEIQERREKDGKINTKKKKSKKGKKNKKKKKGDD